MLINNHFAKVTHEEAAGNIIFTILQPRLNNETVYHQDGTPLPSTLRGFLNNFAQRIENHQSTGQKVDNYFDLYPGVIDEPATINAFLDNHATIIQGAYESFELSRDAVYTGFGRTQRNLPPLSDVRDRVQEVVSNTKLHCLNGDTNTILNYDSTELQTGEIRQPDHIYVIVCGSNKLGRGLTIDGLCTTIFHRKGNAQDTDMQRQRWFGYRGRHLEFIRIFMPSEQWDSSPTGLYQTNRNVTDDYYEGIVQNWNINSKPDQQKPEWGFSLVPGQQQPSSFVQVSSFNMMGPKKFRVVAHNPTTSEFQQNMQWVHDLVDEMVRRGMPPNLWTHPHWNSNTPGIFCGQEFNGGTQPPTQGTLHGARFNVLDLADWLERFLIPQHNPPNPPMVGTLGPISSQHAPSTWGRFYRNPPAGSTPNDRWANPNGLGSTAYRANDPYLIAAYLRLWHYGYANRGQPNAPSWTASLEEPPEFNILIRQGNSQTTVALGSSSPIDFQLGVWGQNPPDADGKVDNLQWGSMAGLAPHGSDQRMDDIRPSTDWPGISTNELRVLNTERKRDRRSDEPGYLLIYLRECPNGGGGFIPALLFSIPEGGPVIGIP